jgi:hypothetical protein
VINLVREKFVPVAVNLYKIREDKGAAGALFQSVQKQRPQYQGLWLVSPEGKVLSAHHEIKSHATWTREVLDMLDAGLKAFGIREGERPASQGSAEPGAPGVGGNPLPHRGVGLLPDGGACLALYSRCIRGGGRERAPTESNPNTLWLWDGAVKADGPVVIDNVTLTAAEWAQIAPKRLKAGEEWQVPEAIARKFARALSPSSDQSTMPKPEEATVAELKARVESVEGGRARVGLTGRWSAKHIYDGKPSYAWASGKGTLSLAQGRPESLLLVVTGAYRMAPPYDTSDRPIGAVVEWRNK